MYEKMVAEADWMVVAMRSRRQDADVISEAASYVGLAGSLPFPCPSGPSPLGFFLSNAPSELSQKGCFARSGLRAVSWSPRAKTGPFGGLYGRAREKERRVNDIGPWM